MRFFFFLALTFALFSAAEAQKSVPLRVSWKFENVEAGYDHLNRCTVYIDGQPAATSSETVQTRSNSVKVEVPKGRHLVEVVNYAFYEGVWEEHTIENSYSVNCTFGRELVFKKKPVSISLVFDLDSEVKSKVN